VGICRRGSYPDTRMLLPPYHPDEDTIAC
jgi:hypothetical protein